MPILNYQTQPDGLLIESDRGQLQLIVYSSRAIRVRYTRRAEFGNQPSLMIVAQPDAQVPFELRETADSLVFATPDLSIAIDRQTLAFTYRDAADRLLTREPARGGKTLEPMDVAVSVFTEAEIKEDQQ
jgi:alpha-D-xyloside xylohydrolase